MEAMRSAPERRSWEASGRWKRSGLLSSSKSEASLSTRKFATASSIALGKPTSTWWLEDPQLCARVDLRRAMHTRRIAELEEAISIGSSAQLYREELDLGHRALDMERKLAARARIKEAERTRDFELWYAAVREGESAGLSSNVLADTMRELSVEKARIAARSQLGHAARTPATAKDKATSLRSALARGEEVGLTEAELGRFRAAMVSLEEQLDAQRALREAVESRDPGELEAALQRGLSLHIGRCQEFLTAERALREERERAACRKQLKDACLRKAPTLQDQMEALRTAVERGEAAGLSEPELAHARGTLASDELIDAARAKLQAAERSQKLEDLLAAIEDGGSAGLDPSELANARRLQVDAYRPAARERLKAAVASLDIEELKAAITYGEEVGITNVGLAEAVETLASEERKAKARAGLREVAPGREIAKLFTAIKYGEGTGLTEPELEPYRVILAEEQRKAAAREGLMEAEVGGEIQPLQAALEEGEAAGLEAPELMGCRRVLAEAVEEKVFRALAQATEGRKVPELEAAVKAAESGSLQVDRLYELLEGEGRGPRIDDLLSQAREILVVETRKARAREWAREAERRRDLEDLRAACREGEAVGLTYLEIRGAQAALAEEEIRVPALERLRVAVESRDIAALRGAIIEGDKAKLTRAELRDARETLAVEERKASARSLIERAALRHHVRDLEAALTNGRAAGLGQEELESFEAVLAEERRIVARAAVAGAEQSRSIPELQRAIRQAERVGLEETEIAQARETLAVERLQAATGSDAVITLRTAIAEGDRRVPASTLLPPARGSLTAAQRREAARQALQAAEHTTEPAELLAAIKRGRREGLEEWELASAAQALERFRRVFSSQNEDMRRVLLAPVST